MNKWIGKQFESSSCKTDEFMEFVSDLRKHIKKQINGKLVKYNVGHFEVSFFILIGEQLWYVKVGDVRDSGWSNRVLFRTPKSDTDYSGGSNQYCKFENISSIGG